MRLASSFGVSSDRLRAAGGGATVVDLAHDGSDLIGRGTADGVAEQGGMSARAFAACRCTPLGRLPSRIRVQRNHFGFGFARHVDTFSPPDLSLCLSSPTLRRRYGAALH